MRRQGTFECDGRTFGPFLVEWNAVFDAKEGVGEFTGKVWLDYGTALSLSSKHLLFRESDYLMIYGAPLMVMLGAYDGTTATFQP